MVVDGKVAFIGSANFTYSGLDANREYDVETSEAAVVAAVSAVFEAETNETDHGWGARELANLSQQGVHVEILHRPYLHAKLILADGRAFIGSENLSATSLEHNREVGMILRDSELVEQLQQQFDSDSAVALAPNRL